VLEVIAYSSSETPVSRQGWDTGRDGEGGSGSFILPLSGLALPGLSLVKPYCPEPRPCSLSVLIGYFFKHVNNRWLLSHKERLRNT
jgi:hypothetical protein